MIWQPNFASVTLKVRAFLFEEKSRRKKERNKEIVCANIETSENTYIHMKFNLGMIFYLLFFAFELMIESLLFIRIFIKCSN